MGYIGLIEDKVDIIKNIKRLFSLKHVDINREFEESVQDILSSIFVVSAYGSIIEEHPQMLVSDEYLPKPIDEIKDALIMLAKLRQKGIGTFKGYDLPEQEACRTGYMLLSEFVPVDIAMLYDRYSASLVVSLTEGVEYFDVENAKIVARVLRDKQKRALLLLQEFDERIVSQ